MAVVTKYASAYPTPGSGIVPDAVMAEGKTKGVCGIIDIGNGDSAGSVYFLGRVPSHARIKPISKLYHEAVAGVTSAHIGFPSAPSALAAALDLSAAGNKDVLAAVNVTNYGMRVWQLENLLADPGGLRDIILTINTASTAAKRVIVFVESADRS